MTNNIKSIIILIPLVLLGSCTNSDGREKLVIYSPHGKEILQDYEEAFEAIHPEVDVQWLDMGSATVYDRIRTERQNPQASLWWGAPHTIFTQATAEGLLEAYQPSWHESVAETSKDSNDYWYGTFLTPEGIAYNTDTIKPEEVPQNWDDLLDPKWKDRILIRFPLESGTMSTIWGAMILRQPSLQTGYDWLAKLDENTKSYTADPTQLYLKLGRREGDITVWNLTDIYIQRANGYPFGFVFPEGETPVLVDGIALVKNGPNLERAKAFYEFVTTQEALLHQAETNFRIPARTDIDTEKFPEWLKAIKLSPMQLDWERLAKEGSSWMEYWDENIKGRGATYRQENPLP